MRQFDARESDARNGFRMPNPDVFFLDSPDIEASDLRLRKVERVPGYRPSCIALQWHAGESGGMPECDTTFNAISDTRWQRGDAIDVTIRIDAPHPLRAGGVLDIRLPFVPEALGDRRFGTVFAMSFRLDRPSVVGGAQLGLFEGPSYKNIWGLTHGPVTHVARAARVKGKLTDPALVLRLHLNAFEGGFTLRLARAFVGQDYDPFLFNPYLERLAALSGPIDLGRAAEAKEEFLHKAEEAMRLNDFRGEQCFLKPFIVSRGVRPSFPLLIGTPNSLNWYGQNANHNCEFYIDDGYVRPGDVVLDCGAHAGEIASIFAHGVEQKGKVIAFDPFPQNHLQVEAQALLNETPWLDGVCAGVGPQHAIIPTQLELQQTFGPKDGGISRSSFPLKIVPLDDYIDLAPSFIKIDIEGAEAGCLQGAQKLLRRHKPRIFVEVHPLFLPDFNHSVQDFLDLIPKDLFRVEFLVPGGPQGWTECDANTAALFEGKPGGLVRANPR